MSQPTQEVTDSAPPSVDLKSDNSELYRHLTTGHIAVVVIHDRIAILVLTKMDLITHLSKKA